MAQLYGTKLTLTTGDVYIPEIWSKDLTEFREEQLHMGKWVDRRTVESTDLLHIPYTTALAAPAAIDANGDMADVTPDTDTKLDVNITTRVGYKINIPDTLSLAAKYDLAEVKKRNAGYGIGLKMEDDLIGLWSGLSQIVGDQGSDISPTRFLRAVQKLNEANAPSESRYALISPSQMTVFLDTPRFVNTDSVGYSKSESPIVSGRFGQAYGVEIAWSNRLVVDTGVNNLLWQKDAFVLAMLKDVTSVEFAKTAFARSFGVMTIYGVAEKRDDHAIVMKSQ